MTKLKYIITLVTGLCFLLSLSCISAIDINHTPTDPTTSNDTTPINEYQPVTDSFDDSNNTNENLQPGSFEELKHDIESLKSGDTYDINKDYYFNDNGENIPSNNRVIEIDRNDITINGNGHIIDAGGASQYFAIFKIYGNNVKICNLTFINSQPKGTAYKIQINDEMKMEDNYNPSPVAWYGNDGIISDCTFEDTKASIGGGICWNGNNGHIKNCNFINNTAQTIGGAIYIWGEGNSLEYNTCINCASELTHEAIFVDRSRSDFTILGGKFESCSRLLVDGAASNIDVENLGFAVYTNFTDYKINLVNIMYSSIMNNGLSYTDNDITYYAQYLTESHEYILTLSRDIDGFSYKKDYCFKDITDLNQIFDLLHNGRFNNKMTLIINERVNSESDYCDLIKRPLSFYLENLDTTIKNELIEPILKNDVIFALNINFEKTLSFKCTDSWKPSERGFDIVNINGKYSKIYGSYDDDKEEKWAVLNEKDSFSASDLYIEGFNTAVENMGGYCIFNDVTFNKNKMDYWFERDWGAAILNTGVIFCNECKFTNNYAKNGGAIFNQGQLILNSCQFIKNEACGKGDDICVGNGGSVIIDGKENTEDNHHSTVYFAKSLDERTCCLITSICYIGSLIGGIVVGALTANPVAGLFAGAAIGAAIGSAGAAIIVSQQYDVNYNRLETCLFLIIGCTALGAIGGVIGGFMTATTPEIAAARAEMIANEADITSQITYDSSGISSIGDESVIIDLNL